MYSFFEPGWNVQFQKLLNFVTSLYLISDEFSDEIYRICSQPGAFLTALKFAFSLEGSSNALKFSFLPACENSDLSFELFLESSHFLDFRNLIFGFLKSGFRSFWYLFLESGFENLCKKPESGRRKARFFSTLTQVFEQI